MLFVSLTSLLFVSLIHACDIRWLHVPKTASTFCLSIQKACDENRFIEASRDIPLTGKDYDTKTLRLRSAPVRLRKACLYIVAVPYPAGPVNIHKPLNWTEFPSATDVISLFRNPKSRLVSAYLDHYHLEGMSADRRDELKGLMPVEYGHHKSVESAVANFKAYGSFAPDNFGCQTKMILGYPCHARVDITRDMLVKAIRIMQTFRFIGVTEYYESSVLLFNRMMGMTTPVHPLELQHYRVSTVRPDVVRAVQNLTYHDPFDTVIYQAAQMLFRQKLIEYNISIPSSLHPYCGEDPVEVLLVHPGHSC